MGKTKWVSFSLVLLLAVSFALLEQRRSHYFIDTPTPGLNGHGGLDYSLASFMQRFEWTLYDLRFKLRGARSPIPQVVIIKIDDHSIDALHQWPWPRGIHAQLINQLAAHPPKALLFDIFFVDPFTSDPKGDLALADATRRNPWVVHSLYFEKVNDQVMKVTPPYPALLKALHQIGNVNASVDEDGVLRRAALDCVIDGQHLPLLSAVGASLYENQPAAEVLRNVAVDPRGRMMLNYPGKEYSFPYYSYADVLSGVVSPETFAGKVVLVGSTATGTFDHYPTPLSQFMPGVEYHATALDNLLSGRVLRVAGIAYTYLIIGLLAILCGWGIARLSAGQGAAAVVALALALLGGAQWLFSARQIVIDTAGPLATLMLGYLVVVTYRFFAEEKEKRWVKAAFGRYVSPKVLDELVKDPSKVNLVGERREMSVFFSDVAGFTSISERLHPDELVILLNKYLSAMTEIVLEGDGYLNKYMGDGIMAFWNAPVKQQDHAERACACALKSMRRLTDLNIELEAQGLVTLKARIGINSGVMVVGDMGSQQHSDYTVMGDNVNLGSRLEGANKAFGTAIMISEFTYELIQDKFEVRFLDRIRVPGKAKPVKTYELLSEKGQLPGPWQEALPVYHEAIQAFADRDFERAKERFVEALEALGRDKACETYIDRATLFIAKPPVKEWDGVFELKTK
jgi:adenylate cyclase